MINTSTYEVVANSTLIKSKFNFFNIPIGTLTHGDKIEVTSIKNDRAYFLYHNKNAYVNLPNIKEIVHAGSISIHYLDFDTDEEISNSLTYSQLNFGCYTHHFLDIDDYIVYGVSVYKVVIDYDHPNADITFYYKKC